MAVQAKICGISTPEALDAALAGGASHIGFVFFPKSPRNVTPDQAVALVERMAGRARSVALFVDPDPDFLAETMQRGGFAGIPHEWWHFDHGDRERVRRELPRIY